MSEKYMNSDVYRRRAFNDFNQNVKAPSMISSKLYSLNIRIFLIILNLMKNWDLSLVKDSNMATIDDQNKPLQKIKIT